MGLYSPVPKGCWSKSRHTAFLPPRVEPPQVVGRASSSQKRGAILTSNATTNETSTDPSSVIWNPQIIYNGEISSAQRRALLVVAVGEGDIMPLAGIKPVATLVAGKLDYIQTFGQGGIEEKPMHGAVGSKSADLRLGQYAGL